MQSGNALDHEVERVRSVILLKHGNDHLNQGGVSRIFDVLGLYIYHDVLGDAFDDISVQGQTFLALRLSD